MAEKGKDVTTEEQIMALLEKEAVRRDEFKRNLQDLLSRKDRELREQKTGGHEATVPDLVKRLVYVDNAVVSLLHQCENFTLDDVITRTNERDSGIVGSGDIDNLKRQAVYLPGLPPEMVNVGRVGAAAQEQEPEEGFPERVDAGDSLPDDPEAIHSPLREPQQHTDQSSSDTE